eukprot:TRINITY_DN41500_c0_g1_i1.p1 TRINITY_DN41500_c0_g1~~TRINITY_DN41500_c0_g1_i1.p1  ORF type:complete len:400 (+),score=93.39 TRINITY_DN41500_c0_g1_i1:57-1256(+)
MRPLVLLAYAAACLGLAPLHPAPAGAEVPNTYVVVFAKDATQEAIDKHLASVQGVKKVYNINNDFRAYAAVFDDASLQAARADAAVAYINADQVVHAVACAEQQNAEWNLDRSSAATAPAMSGNFNYDTNDGQGVDVYVIDTGIRTSHQEFDNGRATWGYNTVGDGNDSDCNGHGTHVAGTVGGKEYGLAKKANLIAVKVLSCGGSGTWNGVIDGIQWTAQRHQASGKKISVLNMSLGGGYMQAVNDATDAAVRAGVVAAVASGNSNADACNFSPASSSLAVGVNAAALESDASGNNADGRSSFSNFGQCTKIFAPGSSVKSAWHTSDTATSTLSGTSMASPHVAGIAAQFISRDPTNNDTPAKVLATLQNWAGKDLVNLRCSSAACQQTPNLYAHAKC